MHAATIGSKLTHAPYLSGSAMLTTAIRTSALVDARAIAIEVTARSALVPWPLVFIISALVALLVTQLVVRGYIRYVACF